MDEINQNIIPHNFSVLKTDRQKLNGHKSCVLWFTGLSGSGKSTMAQALDVELHKLKIHTYVLDGDNIRSGLNKDLDFSSESREENIRRIGEVARLFVDAGIVVLSAFISPFQKDRDKVRELLEPGEFVEIYTDTSLEKCEERDVKGLYKKARMGEIKNFTGISSPYEMPLNPEIYLDTANKSIEENLAELLVQVKKYIF